MTTHKLGAFLQDLQCNLVEKLAFTGGQQEAGGLC